MQGDHRVPGDFVISENQPPARRPRRWTQRQTSRSTVPYRPASLHCRSGKLFSRKKTKKKREKYRARLTEKRTPRRVTSSPRRDASNRNSLDNRIHQKKEKRPNTITLSYLLVRRRTVSLPRFNHERDSRMNTRAHIHHPPKNKASAPIFILISK